MIGERYNFSPIIVFYIDILRKSAIIFTRYSERRACLMDYTCFEKFAVSPSGEHIGDFACSDDCFVRIIKVESNEKTLLVIM